MRLRTSKTNVRDLMVLLAWAATLTEIMINTFQNRAGCLAFRNGLYGDPCLALSDLGLVFVAAVGAGLAFDDERFVFIGFLGSHAVASILFLALVTAPILLGLVTDPALSHFIVFESIVLAVRSQFPVALVLSLSGCAVGAYLGSKLGTSEP